MDEIQQRLRTTADACIAAYEAWSGAKKDGAVRESLMEAVHELRKVAARVEIEMAVSERDEMASRPIPIPPHRASRKQGGDFGADDNIGNTVDNSGGNNHQQHQGGGGGGGGMSHRDRLRRRPQQGRPNNNQGGGGGGGGQSQGSGPSEE